LPLDDVGIGEILLGLSTQNAMKPHDEKGKEQME
jgi:hypothetical protein